MIRVNRLAFLAVLTLTAVVAVACGNNDEGAADPTATPEATSTTAPVLSVVTTIYPVTYFSESVGGERVTVRSLVGTGVDAHDFEPTPQDIIEIRDADVLVYASPDFETWIEDAIATAGSDDLITVMTVNVRGDLDPVHDDDDEHGHEGEEEGHADEEKHDHEDDQHDHENGEESHAEENEHGHADEDEDGHSDGDDHDHDHEGIDPHLWLNPLRATELVRAIEQAFIQADPAGEREYSQNADSIVAFLLQLDLEFQMALNSCQQRHMVVSHEAYGHLAERYSFIQIGLSDLSAEFESTPRRVADIIEEMERLGVSHILQEPILSDELANTVASETGAEILPLHPLESLTPDEVEAGADYFSVMRENLASLKIALQCE